MSCVALILTIRALNLAVPAFYGKMVDVLSGLAPLLTELVYAQNRIAQHGGIGPGIVSVNGSVNMNVYVAVRSSYQQHSGSRNSVIGPNISACDTY